MLPDIAPIFSLVVHELTTNAAKYGALSAPEGRLDVTLTVEPDGVRLVWKERDGLQVTAPAEIGFGIAMIRRAVQHELGDTTDIAFQAGGLRAEFLLPKRHFDNELAPVAVVQRTPLATAPESDIAELSVPVSVLLLEDNFIIAKETADQLRDFGLNNLEIFASAKDALSFLQAETPSLAVPDINLGTSGNS